MAVEFTQLVALKCFSFIKKISYVELLLEKIVQFPIGQEDQTTHIHKILYSWNG